MSIRGGNYELKECFTPNLPAGLLNRRLKSGKAKIDSVLGLEKRCSQCEEFWPQDTQFWAISKTTADGLQHWCRGCQNENRRIRREERQLSCFKDCGEIDYCY